MLAEKRKVSLTDMLERTLLGHPEPKVSNARRTELIEDLYRRYGLIEQPEQVPVTSPPPCGFKELPPPAPAPAPAPDPDREFLQAQAVQCECERCGEDQAPAAGTAAGTATATATATDA